MNDEILDEILDRAMVARIATVSRSGRPHVNPLYFIVDRPQGNDARRDDAHGYHHIHPGTASYTLAAHNVAANPAVQILFEIERAPDDSRMVRMDGTAVVRPDPPLMTRYRRAVARKYVISPTGLRNMLVHWREWTPMRRHLRGGAACVIDVTPTAVELITGPAPDQ